MLFGDTHGQVPGVLAGRLYGPGGKKLGASFNGATDGSSVAGSFTGVRSATSQRVNLTLTNVTREQLFYMRTAELSITRFQGETRLNAYSRNDGGGQLNRLKGETFTYAPPSSAYSGGQFTINDRVESADPSLSRTGRRLTGRKSRWNFTGRATPIPSWR